MSPSPTIATFALTVILAIGGGSPGARAADAAPAVRCQNLLDYLKADADGRGGRVLRWGHPGPLVRVVAGSPEMTKEDASYVVWLINKELPPGWQLKFSKVPAKREAKFEWGIIKVVYLQREKWPVKDNRPDLARAYSLPDKSGMILAAGVLLDHTRIPRERDRIHILLHEVLHALGRAHVSRRAFPETIMHPKASRDHLASFRSLDRAALRAIHSPLVPVGARGDDLRCDSQGRIRNGQ